MKKPPKYYESKPYNPIRIGELIDGRDKWWKIEKHTDEDALGRELVELLQEKLNRTFDAWGTLAGVTWNLSVSRDELLAS